MFVFGASTLVNFVSAVLGSSRPRPVHTAALRAEGWWWQPKTSQPFWNNRGFGRRELLGHAQWCGAGCLCLCLGLVSTELPPALNGGENRCRLYFHWPDPLPLPWNRSVCYSMYKHSCSAGQIPLGVFLSIYIYCITSPSSRCCAFHTFQRESRRCGLECCQGIWLLGFDSVQLNCIVLFMQKFPLFLCRSQVGRLPRLPPINKS